MKSLLYFLLTLLMTTPSSGQTFTTDEKEIIGTQPGKIMRILKVGNKQDSTLLRSESSDLPIAEIGSETFNTLISRMYATVTDQSHQGVGIAAPQVGIMRRIIMVQRFDKEGEPFEAYVNPRIVEQSEDSQVGDEGCLSVDGYKGSVLRSAQIRIAYADPSSGGEIEETVCGFTAVIFQHEIDHLDGILFTDREQENRIELISYTPKGVCAKAINIVVENGLISGVEVDGGCSGNSQGLIALLEGMSAEEAVRRLEGIKCKDKDTSCPAQLAIALKQII